MKKEQKIRRAARIVAKGYIKTLEEGREPARLAAQVEFSKYDILGNVNDDRLNMTDTLVSVQREAFSMIKMELENRPELANVLIGFRKARAEKEEASEREEMRKANAPLGRFLANLKKA